MNIALGRGFNFSESAVARVIVAIAFMILCSSLRFNLLYVPITLQTFAVYLIAMRLCPREAFVSLLGFLAIRCFGLPWSFSATAGYLVGMLVAAPLVSFMIRKGISKMASCIVGSFLIKGLGVLWLLNIMNLKSAVLFGFVPFIIPSIMKINFALGINSFLNRK